MRSPVRQNPAPLQSTFPHRFHIGIVWTLLACTVERLSTVVVAQKEEGQLLLRVAPMKPRFTFRIADIKAKVIDGYKYKRYK